jgi:antitoxin ParD1/3/4
MRTNIEIDPSLMDAVMASGLYATKRAAVEEGLRMLRRRIAAKALLELGGKVDWQGDLDAWRADKPRKAMPAVKARQPK